MSQKLALVIDESVPLVFVQHKVGPHFDVYQDGKLVRGIKTIRIYAGIDEFTTHEIEYVTGKTKEDAQ